MTFETHDESETWAVAKQFAATLRPGDVVCLEGDLGAGKTTFTQGLCAALGAKRAVTSPTFCIVSEHPAPDYLVVHMDLYRLHGEEDVLQIGWEDYLAREAILAVEWSENVEDIFDGSEVRVQIEKLSDTGRRITAEGGGQC